MLSANIIRHLYEPNTADAEKRVINELTMVWKYLPKTRFCGEKVQDD